LKRLEWKRFHPSVAHDISGAFDAAIRVSLEGQRRLMQRRATARRGMRCALERSRLANAARQDALSCRRKSAARSPITTHGAIVLPDVTRGITDASAGADVDCARPPA
jgi:hypothetical protein